ncbi:MAG: hypothetical protein FJZ01_23460 [Candidatus Sericytochromatia bacterium]|nr:hypothetical protein [Candidatus Tanganyikabacteria bacterium]
MRVAITGMALASPFGSAEDAFWHGICHGPTPVRPYSSEPDYPGLACLSAALPADSFPPRPDLGWHRAAHLGADLGQRALVAAGYGALPSGVGLALGSYWSEEDHARRSQPPPLLPALLSDLGITGPAANLPVACASGNTAIAWGAARIRNGHAPVMLAGGLDVLGPLAAGSYLYLDNLTHNLPRPFSANRDGFLYGEGGAMFVLEPLETARQAGRLILAEVCGTGNAHDASHPTRPDPAGGGLVRAMRQALAQAGLEPAAVGYVNAHSPGTIVNDPGEAAALATVFGPRKVPVSSTKGALGHAQGGANALEAAACVLALRHGLAPPTMNLDAPDPALAIDAIAGSPRPLSTRFALSLASSLGGATCAILLGKGDGA